MSCAETEKKIRKTWIPLLKKMLAVIADIWGSWVFYKETKNDDDVKFEVYVKPLFVLFIISCILAVVTFNTVICKGMCQYAGKRKNRYLGFFCKWMNYILGTESFIHDVPQFIVTAMISNERDELTNVAVFNLATSAFNFIITFLDILTPLNDDDVCHEEFVCNTETSSCNCPKCT